MRILFAWEIGGGLGHVARLAPWLRQFSSLGATPILAVRNLNALAQAPDFSAPMVVQAPVLSHGPLNPGFEAGCYAELLLAAGYGNPATLKALLHAWLALMRLGAVGALVGDYAPTALLAARVAGIPVLHVGDGFTIPPSGPHAWSFREPAATDQARHDAACKRVLDCVNGVLADAGVAPMQSFGELTRAETTIMATYPELDHYRGSPRPDGFAGHFDNPGVDGQGWRPVPGPRILAYLNPVEPQFEAVVAALGRMAAQTRIYAAGLSRGDDSANGLGRRWSREPIGLAAALADADLVISHAGHGLACTSLLAGKPLCMLPGNQEQALTARNVEAIGAGVRIPPSSEPKRIVRLIERTIEGSAPRAAAEAFAARHRAHAATAAVRLAETADRFLALVKRGIAA